MLVVFSRICVLLFTFF